MTALRPIEPIDTRGLTPKAPATGMPIFEHVDPRTLFVDPAYQRSLGERSIRQIRRIVENFDWTKFKPPVCALSEEDGLMQLRIIDGQHTCIAAASIPGLTSIPVMIVEAPDTRAQAQAFIGQNTDRLGVTAIQMQIAAVAAGDKDAIRLAAVCERAGVNLLRAPPSAGAYKPGDTVAVAAIGALIKKVGEDETVRILSILSAAGLAPIKADHIKAVDRLLSEIEFGTIDPDGLASSIGAYPAAMKDAGAFAATHGLPLWKAMASVWFQKAKKRRKPSVEGEKLSVEAGPLQLRSQAPTERASPLPDELAERDPRPARGDWQPGNQIARCRSCDVRFRGGPAAKQCADCAYGERRGAL